MLFETKHAIGMTCGDVELLMHIGLDTVSLGGKYFTAKVQAGDQVRQGDLLIEFDMDQIKKAGYDIVTPVIVTNSDQFANVVPVRTSGKIRSGSNFLTVNG